MCFGLCCECKVCGIWLSDNGVCDSTCPQILGIFIGYQCHASAHQWGLLEKTEYSGDWQWDQMAWINIDMVGFIVTVFSIRSGGHARFSQGCQLKMWKGPDAEELSSPMVQDTKSPLLLYNQNRKVRFYLNSYPSSQNALISKRIITARPISLKLKIVGEIVFVSVRLATETENYYIRHMVLGAPA